METHSSNPCEGCPAPCCTMQITHHAVPETALSVDYIRYYLLFPNTELIISADGHFSFVKWQHCRMFDEGTCSCSVHSTPKQPLTCVNFSGDDCWYKRNFVTDEPVDICRLNLERFEQWTQAVSIDRNGLVTALPDFAGMQQQLRTIPIAPEMKMNAGYIKSAAVHARQPAVDITSAAR